MKRFFALGLSLVMLVTMLSACSSHEKKEQFVVGFDQEFPPMGFVDEDGSYVGFDLDLAKEVADRLDMEYVAQPIAWDSKDQELESGNVDCIWNGFTMNNREDDYTWTDAYMNNDQIVLVDPDSGITTLADLAGKTVVLSGSGGVNNALSLG